MINKRNNGFSLVELMIVVAILGVLAAIAMPTYTGYTQRGNRADAHQALLEAAALQEQIFVTNQAYSSDMTDLGGAASENGHYTLAATTTNSDRSFSVTATASSAMQLRDTDCRTLTIDNLGRQTSTNSEGNPSTGCW